jgi:hypothetical protein
LTYEPFRWRSRPQQQAERKRPGQFRSDLTKMDGGPDHWERYAKELETAVLDLQQKNRQLAYDLESELQLREAKGETDDGEKPIYTYRPPEPTEKVGPGEG